MNFLRTASTNVSSAHKFQPPPPPRKFKKREKNHSHTDECYNDRKNKINLHIIRKGGMPSIAKATRIPWRHSSTSYKANILNGPLRWYSMRDLNKWSLHERLATIIATLPSATRHSKWGLLCTRMHTMCALRHSSFPNLFIFWGGSLNRFLRDGADDQVAELPGRLPPFFPPIRYANFRSF